MVKAVVDEDTFINLVETLGFSKTAREIGVSVRAVHSRVNRIEKSRGIRFLIPTSQLSKRQPHTTIRREATVKSGGVVIGSDAHYWWPHDISTAHAAPGGDIKR